VRKGSTEKPYGVEHGWSMTLFCVLVVRGVECSGCLERKDLVQRLLDHLTGSKGGKPESESFCQAASGRVEEDVSGCKAKPEGEGARGGARERPASCRHCGIPLSRDDKKADSGASAGGQCAQCARQRAAKTKAPRGVTISKSTNTDGHLLEDR
jgi:hypothetical protein